jgi:hypothetical protein
MTRDILFLVQRLPQKYCFSGQNVFTSPADEAFTNKLSKLSEAIPDLKPFFANDSAGLVVIGFRNDADGEREAVRQAWERLSCMLDAISFLIEGHQPRVCSTAIIHEADNPDASIKEYMPIGWASWGAPQEKVLKHAEERNALFADYVLAFFSFVAFVDDTQATDLVRQLAYSAKMTRQGINSASSGIEYLCKFSALEGLVCGPETKNKGSILSGRLGCLFQASMPQVAKDVDRLWKQRCVASHQAAAHDLKLLADLPLVDLLFRGCFVFALDHVNTVTSVPELWKKLGGSYQLPKLLTQDRPVGMVRVPFMDGVLDHKLHFQNIGHLIDQCFAESAKKAAQST